MEKVLLAAVVLRVLFSLSPFFSEACDPSEVTCCDEAFSCFGKSLRNSEDHECNGYHSCASSSIIPPSDTNDADVGCRGSFSCFNSTIELPPNEKLRCTGAYSCAHSTVTSGFILGYSELCLHKSTVRLTGSEDSHAGGHLGWSDAHIFIASGGVLELSSSVSALNSIIESAHDNIYIELSGAMSGKNLTVICHAENVCHINCLGTDTCNELKLVSKNGDFSINCRYDSQYSEACPEGKIVAQFVQNVMQLPDVTNVTTIETLSTGSDTCFDYVYNNQSLMLFCDAHRQCNEVDVEMLDAMCCVADDCCQRASFSFIDQDISMLEQWVRCDGQDACYYAEIGSELSSNTSTGMGSGIGHVYMAGNEAAKGAIVSTDMNHNIYCTSKESCYKGTFSIANIIFCLGKESCDDETSISMVNKLIAYGEKAIQSGSIDQIYSTVHINGYKACENSKITNVDDSVFIQGFAACTNARISHVSDLVAAIGWQAMRGSNVFNVSRLYCDGTSCLFNATVTRVSEIKIAGTDCLAGAFIISDLEESNKLFKNINNNNNENEADFDMEIFGPNNVSFTVVCSTNDSCRIGCIDDDACINMELYCYGNCTLECSLGTCPFPKHGIPFVPANLLCDGGEDTTSSTSSWSSVSGAWVWLSDSGPFGCAVESIVDTTSTESSENDNTNILWLGSASGDSPDTSFDLEFFEFEVSVFVNATTTTFGEVGVMFRAQTVLENYQFGVSTRAARCDANELSIQVTNVCESTSKPHLFLTGQDLCLLTCLGTLNDDIIDDVNPDKHLLRVKGELDLFDFYYDNVLVWENVYLDNFANFGTLGLITFNQSALFEYAFVKITSPTEAPTFQPSPYPSATPTMVPVWEPTKPPQPITVAEEWNQSGVYVVFGALSLACVISLFAIGDWFGVKKKAGDERKILSVFLFLYQVVDVWTDVSFCVILWHEQSYDLFYASAVFLALPYVFSFVAFFRFNLRWHKWNQDFPSRLHDWLRRYELLLLFATVFGSFYASVDLFRSKLFCFGMWYFPLKREEVDELIYWRLVNFVLFENLPQLCVQLIYLQRENNTVKFIVLVALCTSSVSIMFGVLRLIKNLLHQDACLNPKNAYKNKTNLSGKVKIAFNNQVELHGWYAFCHHKMSSAIYQMLSTCADNGKWKDQPHVYYSVECYHLELQKYTRQLSMYFEIRFLSKLDHEYFETLGEFKQNVVNMFDRKTIIGAQFRKLVGKIMKCKPQQFSFKFDQKTRLQISLSQTSISRGSDVSTLSQKSPSSATDEAKRLSLDVTTTINTAAGTSSATPINTISPGIGEPSRVSIKYME